MKLFKIQHPLTIYVVANDEEEAITTLENVDSGGENYQQFIKTAQTGTITEITNLQQVPKEDHDYVTYGGDDELYCTISIREFFGIKET